MNPALGLLGRIAAEPMLVAPSFTALGETVRHMLDTPFNTEAGGFDEHTESFLNSYCGSYNDPRGERKPYAQVGDTAIVPVHGTLINRFNSSWGFVTGYQYIESALLAAMDDATVSRVVMDVDSYGGEAAGAFELSDTIHQMRGKKPIMALVNTAAYSAAYAVASAADSIVATPSGGAGSIGVVTMHVDYSKALKEAGITVTHIYAGKHKVDGSPYRPLTEEVRDSIQARIDKTYGVFVQNVARNRGLAEKAVRDTEARTYDAADAMNLGLIDAVAPPKQAFAAFTSGSYGPRKKDKMQMSTENEQTAAEAADAGAAAAAPAAAPEAAAPDVTLSAADAVAAERERVKAILSCEEADGRSALANHIALSTDLTVDAAKALLTASPKATAAAAAPGAAFARAMAETGNPEVGADGNSPAADVKPQSAEAILRDARAAGVIPKAK
jgi:signal peptide peptidase SppA